MKSWKSGTRLVALISFCCVSFPGAVLAQDSGVVAGSLTCSGAANIGRVIGSRQSLGCVFEPVGRGPRQRYAATITRVGLDLGIQGPTRMIWTVLGPTNSLQHGALAGNFVGAGANASFLFGAGANVLVGGFGNSIILQPVSVQVQSGVNIAAGVAGLRLTYHGR